ncbi:MAG: Methylmalonyl-CoA decarboxylase, subunit alpha [Thermococcales archaeon 44_46]|jgi:methylmalonyl-CoA decarboxylase alpha subunit|nr:MAG: Methylmalonyl-CoA decarboxylase, subunit alpha [Thermococcales archaeon 44_46]MDK2853272.1 methylmalonyl-CoA decarboxylase subunit alpha [Thermococcaceae archaeon]MDK2982613.1 methylmalonyl-CoA decarboxylase subunit alpha [Thermococcaceae archaeon]
MVMGAALMTMEEKVKELYEKKEKILKMGGEEKIAKQHEKGKLTARERIEKLLDPGSFVELGMFVKHRGTEFGLDKMELPADGVITGYGTIDGRLVFVYAQDFTVMGGSLGEMHAAKIKRIMELALEAGAPVIGLNDSGGARIQEGVDSLKGYGEIFKMNTILSGVVPQITAIMGPCAGGAVYSPAIGDFILMVDNPASYMFITGPQVVKAVTGVEVSPIQLGGAMIHAQKSGQAHLIGKSDEEVLMLIRKLLSYLPSNNMEKPPRYPTNDPPFRKSEKLYEIVPDDPNKGYDVRQVIYEIVDRDANGNPDFLEVLPYFAPNAVVGFGRMNGQTVGIVANNPIHLAGVLDIDSSDKIARFVRTCDAFNIPIVTLVDVPGYLPGVQQEYGGIIRHGAKVLYAYSEATVPMVTVILRKAYGGAYLAMGSKHLGADFVFAWPTAEIAVMGPEGAANIIFRKEIASAENPEAVRQEKIREYREKFANPYVAASRGYIDDVIDPAETRGKIIMALEALESKRVKLPPKKHGNIPL